MNRDHARLITLKSGSVPATATKVSPVGRSATREETLSDSVAKERLTQVNAGRIRAGNLCWFETVQCDMHKRHLGQTRIVGRSRALVS